MARAELEESWITAQDAEELRTAALGILRRRRRMGVRDDQDGELILTEGSQLLTRLLGGWFVPASWLPKRVTVNYRRAADGLRVRACFEETMGFGYLDPILKSKYERYFVEVMDELRDACGDRVD